jgi:hypothetical protein
MAEDESPKSEPEIVAPAIGPLPNRGSRPDPGVIDGEATEILEAAPSAQESAAETAPAAASPAPEPQAPAEESRVHEPAPAAEPVADRPRGGAGRPFLAALLGAVAGAALAFAAAWLFDPRAGALDAANARLTELQHGAEAQTEAAGALDKRLRALEANEAAAAKATALDALGRRLAALESAAGKDETAQTALREARAARDEAAKALALAGATAGPSGAAPAPAGATAAFDASALEARVGKLEADLAALQPAAGELGPLKDRLAKLEAALAAPKSEARVAASESTPGGSAAAAVLAMSLSDRLQAGAPFAEELAALTRLGADGARLAALKPFAPTGAPTVASLAAAYVKLAPAVAAAAAPPSEDGGVVERLLDHMRKLVRVHKIGEAEGDDPEAAASRIGAALTRGDLGAALEAYRRLPEAARQAAGDWAKLAEARQAAGEAALALRAEAVARLATAKD